MQLVDRVEKRRFVGREFLLWLWFESSSFEATLSAGKHANFGLWIERLIVLSVGQEATRIKGTYPAGSREAKEALLAGKLPEAAGLHLSLDGREAFFTLKAERLAISGLALPTVLDDAESDGGPALAASAPPRKAKRAAAPSQEDEADLQHESFYERMHFAREVEDVVESLYRDFIALRLGPAWQAVVVPALRAWMRGGKGFDAEQYRTRRDEAFASPRAKPARARARRRAPVRRP